MKRILDHAFLVFIGFCLIAIARVAVEPRSHHFFLFTQAAQILWGGGNPYGRELGTSIGYWFYSPSCGMFLFGPFYLLSKGLGSEKVALLIYLAFSILVFVGGAIGALRLFSNQLSRSLGRPELTSQLAGFFWIAIVPQMMSAIWNAKLEMLMTGIMFYCLSWIAASKRVFHHWAASGAASGAAPVLLAVIADWKFQPLPSIGLLFLVILLTKKDWKTPLVFVVSFLFWHFVPGLFLGFGSLKNLYFAQSSTLMRFSANALFGFDNVFNFLHSSFGVVLGSGAILPSAAIVGLCFAGIVIKSVLSRKNTARVPPRPEGRGLPVHDDISVLLLNAVGLGCGFTSLFSPLNQNNAFILLAPLWLACIMAWAQSQDGLRKIWGAVLISSFVVLTFGYSDLIPEPLRWKIRDLTIKPAAPLIMCGVLAFQMALRREALTKKQ